MVTVQLSQNEYLEFLKNIKERELWMFISLLALSREGRCTRTQVEIGKALGIHPSTVFKRIKELNSIIVKGHPLVRTVRNGETNVYYILKLT
jgi:DNA-binding MarR family transcriptional regulator